MHLPESLGKVLKKIRESKNLSIEEVSERSRIPKHIVSVLEEDRFDEIKSIFYAKSFVKTYASFLGCATNPSIQEYLAKGTQKQPKKPETILKPITQPKEIPGIDFSIIAKHKKQILAIVIGIFLFWGLSFAVSQVSKVIRNISVKKQSKVIKRAPVKGRKEESNAKDAMKAVKEERLIEKPDFVELEVFALDNTWLQIIGDGELMSTGSFKKGSKDTWKARKEIKLEVGNSGAIKINVNGKPVNFSGKKGEKKEIIITKDGIKN